MSMNSIPRFASIEEACRAVQIDLKREPRLGGWTRADAIDGDRVGRNDGSVMAFSSGRGGYACNWRLNAEALWFNDAERKLTRLEQRALRRERDEEKKKREAEDRDKYAKAATFARHLLSKARPIERAGGHEYLRRKHVRPVASLVVMDADEINAEFQRSYVDWPYRLQADGRPFCGPVLMYPLIDGKNFEDVIGLEFISEEGAKAYLWRARAAGACWVPKELRTLNASPEVVGIAEGLATALSIQQVNGFPVVAARYCGNLPAIAQAVKRRFPGAHLVVLGDKGRGEEDAEKAAKSIRAELYIPTFTDEQVARFKQLTGSASPPTDFNDFYLATEEL